MFKEGVPPTTAEKESEEEKQERIHSMVNRAFTSAIEKPFDIIQFWSSMDLASKTTNEFLKGEKDRETSETEMHTHLDWRDIYEGKVDFTDFDDFCIAVESAYQLMGEGIADYTAAEVAGHEYSHAQEWLKVGITPSYRALFYLVPNRDEATNEIIGWKQALCLSVEVNIDELKVLDDDTLRQAIIASLNAPDFLSQSDKDAVEGFETPEQPADHS